MVSLLHRATINSMKIYMVSLLHRATINKVHNCIAQNKKSLYTLLEVGNSVEAFGKSFKHRTKTHVLHKNFQKSRTVNFKHKQNSVSINISTVCVLRLFCELLPESCSQVTTRSIFVYFFPKTNAHNNSVKMSFYVSLSAV